MTITKAKKQSQLELLKQLFQGAAGVAFASFSGVTVEEAQHARRALRKEGMSYLVVKKTLMSLAAKETGFPDFNPKDLPGAVGVITSETDEIAPAIAIKNMVKETYDKETNTAKFNFAGAFFENKLLSPDEAKALGNIPTRLESIGKILGALQYGIGGIVAALKDSEKIANARANT